MAEGFSLQLSIDQRASVDTRVNVLKIYSNILQEEIISIVEKQIKDKKIF
jgi:hypothetical protein